VRGGGRAAIVAVLVMAAAAQAYAGGEAPHVIYLNRCVGGCVIRDGNQNDSHANTTWFGNDTGPYVLSEFQHGDAVWDAVVECVKDVYAPYNVVITDEDPGDATHDEVYAAGLSSQIGQSAGGLGGGKSPSGSAYCSVASNNVSFAFLNGFSASSVERMCAVIAQESGHSFGMPDHVRDCRDPMASGYYGPCNNAHRAFFQNTMMACGDFADGICICGGARQNDHQHLLNTAGANPDYTPDTPEAAITSPVDGATITANIGFGVSASAHRGIHRGELYLNGWRWAVWTAPEHLGPGSTWPIPSFVLDPPDTFPDGVIDVEVRVYDDIGTSSSTSIQVTKGAACSSETSCLDGQRCVDGKCFWDEPTGELGDACTYDQQCIGPDTYDGTCIEQMCTRLCYGGPNDDCEEGFHCEVMDEAQNSGVCWPDSAEKPGCCSTGSETPFGAIGLAGALAALVLRRRRR
jgi:MYXO-CTERM domain-containing protein